LVRIDIEREEQRAAAMEIHSMLRKSGVSPVELGRFYRTILDDGICTNQVELARLFSTSTGVVSKAMRASTLPEPVITALGGTDRVTFRVAEALAKLVTSLGNEVVCRNAQKIVDGRTLPITVVLAALADGDANVPGDRLVSVSVGTSGRYLKLDVEPRAMARILSRFAEFSEAVETSARKLCAVSGS